MATYKRPGVFIEENLKPLSSTSTSDPTEAQAAFVGTALQGPVEPTLVSSWVQYVTRFGGFGDGSNLLPFAVFQYFNNGGHDCWISRAVVGGGSPAVAATANLADRNNLAVPVLNTPTTATTGGTLTASTTYSYRISAINGNGETLASTPATTFVTGAGTSTNTITLTWAAVSGATGYRIYGRTAGNELRLASLGAVTTYTDTGAAVPSGAAPSSDTTGDPTLTITANAPGTWGNGLSVSVTAVTAADTTARFNLLVYQNGTTDAQIVERYLDVSLDPADGRYAPNIINSPVSGSSYIRVSDIPVGQTYTTAKAPSLATNVPLTAGGEGTGTPDLAAAAYRLESVPNNLILNLPGVNDGGTLNPVIAWAEALGNVFVVVDGPPAAANATADTTATAYLTTATGLTASSYVALYGPWLRTDDPAGRSPGSVRLLPPGGAVIGQYIRTDAARGVQKPPAGLDTQLRGVLDVEVRWLGTNLDSLNDRGVNVVRPIPGAGICIMGGRTLKPGMPDRYVSIRRSLMYIRRALKDNTRFAIFEPNNNDLWEHLDAIVTQYLTGLLQAGVLAGGSADEAFFVKCDEENNPPQQAAAGTVVIEVGVALSAPAEFIVIRIGQFDGGTLTTETVATTV